jgi:hypothetical protein
MRPDISEFSYGYAVTEALIKGRKSSLTAAPYFPSLIKEGKEGGGYDLSLIITGVPLFLQFKLSECIVQSRADVPECAKGLFSPPFYRMHLRPERHSKQHKLLLDLEGKGYLVYYVAPCFYKPAELNDAYLNELVLERSIAVKPEAIGVLPDRYEHHLSFKDYSRIYLFSEPRKLEWPSDFDSFNRYVHTKYSEASQYAVSIDGLRGLRADMVTILRDNRVLFRDRDLSHWQDRDINRQGLLEQVAYLARTYFGCDFLIVSEKSEINDTQQ